MEVQNQFAEMCGSLYKQWFLPRRQWQATPVLLPRKSHGWRSLVGCSPWGRYKLDATERLHFHFSLSHNEEGNGNPLQCSCLENPGDGRAWPTGGGCRRCGSTSAWTRSSSTRRSGRSGAVATGLTNTTT